jgi:ABC-type Mn2+/Zn2+ transport system ATPase subunit
MIEIKTRSEKITPEITSLVDLQLEAGMGVLIYGENGIGKTSLLKKIIDKYQNQYSMSYAFQESLDLFYDRTIYEIKRTVKRTLKDVIDTKKLDELFSSFSLEQKGNRTLSQLSGGEMQSLKLSLSFAKLADIYIFDEPLKALDLEKKIIVMRNLENLLFHNKVVLVVEHQLLSFDSSWQKLKLVQKNLFLQMEER